MNSTAKLSLKEATSLILEGTVQSFGFKKAFYHDMKDHNPMELGWFDLHEGDHQARIENDSLLLDLWFNDYGFRLSEDAIKDRRKVPIPEGSVFQIKLTFRVPLQDIDYLHLNSKRIFIDGREEDGNRKNDA